MILSNEMVIRRLPYCRGWVLDEAHPTIRDLTNRISAVLGLVPSSAEGFQVTVTLIILPSRRKVLARGYFSIFTS